MGTGVSHPEYNVLHRFGRDTSPGGPWRKATNCSIAAFPLGYQLAKEAIFVEKLKRDLPDLTPLSIQAPNIYCFLFSQLRKADAGNFPAFHWAIGCIAVHSTGLQQC